MGSKSVTLSGDKRHATATVTVPFNVSFKYDPPPPRTTAEAQYYLLLTAQTGDGRPRDTQVFVLKTGQHGNRAELSGQGGGKKGGRLPEHAPVAFRQSPTGEYTVSYTDGRVRLVSHGAPGGDEMRTFGVFLQPPAGAELKLVFGSPQRTKDNLLLPEGTTIHARSGFEFFDDVDGEEPPAPPLVEQPPQPPIPPTPQPPIVLPPGVLPSPPTTTPAPSSGGSNDNERRRVLIAKVGAALAEYFAGDDPAIAALVQLASRRLAGEKIDEVTVLLQLASSFLDPEDAAVAAALGAIVAARRRK